MYLHFLHAYTAYRQTSVSSNAVRTLVSTICPALAAKSAKNLFMYSYLIPLQKGIPLPSVLQKLKVEKAPVRFDLEDLWLPSL